jgi:hypothetical protein
MDEAYACDCGSVKFNLIKCGLIECAKCSKHLNGGNAQWVKEDGYIAIATLETHLQVVESFFSKGKGSHDEGFKNGVMTAADYIRTESSNDNYEPR